MRGNADGADGHGLIGLWKGTTDGADGRGLLGLLRAGPRMGTDEVRWMLCLKNLWGLFYLWLVGGAVVAGWKGIASCYRVGSVRHD